MLTQKRLKEVLDYSPETGIFTRIRSGAVITKPNDNGYIRTMVDYKSYYAHKLAWLYVYGVWPDALDHIDHRKPNNRIINLREAAQSENSKNRSTSRNNKSGFNGVHWHERDKGWLAVINVNKKPVYLGQFKDKFEAICARASANNKYGFHPNHGR